MIKVIALIGPSGSGKDTLLTTALEKIPSLSRVVSYTTRPMREGEKEGEDYYFIDYDNFSEKLLNGDFIEANTFNGWGYATGYESFDKNKINIIALDPGRCELLMDNDAFLVYPYLVKCRDKTRLLRQLKREEEPNVEEIVRRYQTDKADFNFIPFPYFSLPNENRKELKQSIEILRNLVKSI